MTLPAPQRVSSVVRTYDQLKTRVRETLIRGQFTIEKLKVQTYWQTGELIHRHLLGRKDRADYGVRLMARLARDLGVGERLLERTLRFYRKYPKIPSPGTELTWSHYRVLTRVPDAKTRAFFERRARRGKWISKRLEREIRTEIRAASSPDEKPGVKEIKPLVPKKGKPGLYRIMEDGGTLHLDKGFTSYAELDPAHARRLKEGDIVSAAGGKLRLEKGAVAGDLYTYPAELRRVIDADTFWMKIYLKGKDWLREKLRLRAVDAPELGTPEGERAKHLVEALFKKSVAITVTTTKPDKWDRYLADIFLLMPDQTEIFLNYWLLEQGLASAKTKYTPGDWETE